MRKVVLWGLAAALLAGTALTVMPGDGRAQLFNSSKKQEQTEPAPNTTKGGSGGGGAPVFNSGSGGGSGGAKPIFTDPTLKQNNSGGQARPYGSATPTMQRTPPKSNNGFARPGSTVESDQDRRIREAAMRRVQASGSKVAEVRANLDRMEAEREAGKAPVPSVSGREDRAFGTMVPETVGQKPTGPMVYEKHNNTKNDAPAKLFNSTR